MSEPAESASALVAEAKETLREIAQRFLDGAKKKERVDPDGTLAKRAKACRTIIARNQSS